MQRYLVEKEKREGIRKKITRDAPPRTVAARGEILTAAHTVKEENPQPWVDVLCDALARHYSVAVSRE